MTEPTRLLRQGTPLAKAILGAAEHDPPPAELRRNIHAAIVVASAGTGLVAATTATKTSSLLASLGVGKWVGIVAVASVVSVGAGAIVRARSAKTDAKNDYTSRVSTAIVPQSRAQGHEARGGALPHGIPPVPEATETAAAATSTSAMPAHLDVARASSPSTALSPQASPIAEADFTREVVALDEARASLEAGDLATTIDRLNRHDLDYPQGHLRPEALAIRIQAYAARHDVVRVRELASQFRAQYPSHPFAARLDAMIESAGR